MPYTLVALVTCLEWHARSRLTDLYSYKPDSIEPTVLAGKVPPKTLSQMIKANVSIAQLLGASFTVGSTVEYIGVFQNLFEILQIPLKAADVVQPPILEHNGLFGDPVREPLVWEILDQLFTTRHAIVHEIGADFGSGRTACELWPPRRILWLCQTVMATIAALEGVLTKQARSDFPNLLSEQGYPVDVRERLTSAIEDLESRITEEIEGRSPEALAAWTEALQFAREAARAHEQLLAHRKLFQERHGTRTSALLRTSLEQRLALLSEIAAALARSGPLDLQ